MENINLMPDVALTVVNRALTVEEELEVIEYIKKDKKKNAEFEITDSFYLTGRGIVVVGNILEGTIKVGSKINIDRKDYLIKGVEFVDNIAQKIFKVGLVLDIADKNLSFKKQLAMVF
jgi:translation elongation factor EF-Tu-like GTPase